MENDLSPIFTALDNRQGEASLPAIFVGHGNPMNAIQDTVFSNAWIDLGLRLPKPKAILCVSAHWLTPGETRVSVTAQPQTIHDFSGFPAQLYDQRYPAPGAPEMAHRVAGMITTRRVLTDDRWGLDHGAWSVLGRLFPAADIPVFQLSLDYRLAPLDHYRLARQLRPLRDEGLLIVGSGNLVHNLRRMRSQGPPYSWAVDFDRRMAEHIDRGEDAAVVDFQALGALAANAHPTWDHFLPLIYVLALRRPSDRVHYFNAGFDLGSISMRSLLLCA